MSDEGRKNEFEEAGRAGESSLLGETEPGKFTCLNAVPEDFTEIVLQGLELH